MSDQAVQAASTVPGHGDGPSGPVRTAFLLAGEPALVTGEALDAAAPRLGELGVLAVVVLAAPGHTLVHVESDGTSESSAVRDGVLGAVLQDGVPASAETFGEIFAWERPAGEDDVAVAIMLRLKAGAAADYRAWLASGVVDTLQQIWARCDIGRHDVLQAGDSVVGYYSCAGPAAVAAAFADPAGVAVMEQGLGDLLDMEATAALPTLEEKITWNA
ncbi:MAG: hypothetical protein ABW004_09945 [Aeromicrobium sp.]